jgi:hypothetical protein
MTVETPRLARSIHRWVLVAGVVGLFALAGCKSNKESKGTNVARGKDPLVYGPARIPQQNLPVPDRATGPKTGVDPLTTVPTGGKAGYNDDPARFQGTFIPGKPSTPAALAGRLRDSDELKIADSGGVVLTPVGGTLPAGTLEPPEDTQPLLAQLEKYGVAAADRSFERDGAKYTFRASVPIRNSNGARRQYTGVGNTAREAVQQVLDQLANEK